MAGFDTHCHLQDERLTADLPSIMERVVTTGITRLLCCGSCENDWAAVAAISDRYQQVLPAFGLHPWYVGTRSSAWRENLEKKLRLYPAAAVGEIGLDHALDTRNDDEQFEVFLDQIDLARKYRRPFSVHCRKAWGSLLALLRKAPEYGKGMILHSYSGSAELVRELESYGVMLSFSGVITFEKNRRAREALRLVSNANLLIETDCPDIPPVNHAGPNEPSTLMLVANAAAQLRGVTTEEIITLTSANAAARLKCQASADFQAKQ